MNFTCERCGARQSATAEGGQVKCGSCGAEQARDQGEADFDEIDTNTVNAPLPPAKKRPGRALDVMSTPPSETGQGVVDTTKADAVVSRDDASGQLGIRIDPKDRDRRPTEPPEPEPEPEAAPPEPKQRAPREPSAEPEAAPLPGSNSAPAAVGDDDDDEPSVIVDMGRLGDASPPRSEEAAEGDSEDQPEPVVEKKRSRATFDPLATPMSMPEEVAPARPKHREAATMMVALEEEPSDIHVVKPPSLLRVLFLLFILTVAAVVGYVGWRNDWAPVLWEKPEHAARIAFGLIEVQAPKPAPPPVDIAPPVEGRLEVHDVQVRLLETGRKRYAAMVQGKLINASNRVHKDIRLEASFSTAAGGVPLRKREIFCCDTFEPQQAIAVATDPKHAHFADRPAGRLSLGPKESRTFVAIIRNVDPSLAKQALYASARIKFSEAELPKR